MRGADLIGYVEPIAGYVGYERDIGIRGRVGDGDQPVEVVVAEDLRKPVDVEQRGEVAGGVSDRFLR